MTTFLISLSSSQSKYKINQSQKTQIYYQTTAYDFNKRDEPNMYWQYFCGYEYLIKDPAVSEATIRRFRNMIGEDG